MKRTSWSLLVLVLAGCAASQPVLKTVRAEPSSPRAVRKSEAIRTYTLGAYIDPEDASIRHDAHQIQRIERASEWELSPNASGLAALPQSVVPAGSETIRSPEAATLPVAARTVQSHLAPLPTAATDDALLPSDEGVIDLTPKPAPSDSALGNPFVVVANADAEKWRQVSIELGGVVGSSTPYALVNGRLMKAGERIDSLELVRIEQQSVLFRFGERKFRISVGSKAVTVRLPN